MARTAMAMDPWTSSTSLSLAIKVKASVCDSCGHGAVIEGLLGLSYLNNFNYKVDSDRGHLILETK